MNSATLTHPTDMRATMDWLARQAGLGLLIAAVIVNAANFRVANPSEVTHDWQTMSRLALCALCGGYAALNLPQVFAALTRFPMAWLIVFNAWAWVTLPAAIAPAYTLAACTALSTTTIFSAALLARVPSESIVKALIGSVLLLTIGCWIAQFTRPELGQPEYLTPGHEPSTWRLGGLMHPNGLGAHCALAIGLLLVGRVSWNWRWTTITPLGLLLAASLLATGSRTSFAMLLAAVSLFGVRKNSGLFALAMAGLAGIAALVLAGEAVGANWTDLSLRFTRDQDLRELSTFTGRTDLWAIALDWISQSPVWGHGYGCSRFLILDRATFPATHPHNLFLDTAAEAGITGMLIETAMFVALARRLFFRPCFFADTVLVLVGVMALVEVPIFNPLPEIFSFAWMLALGWRQGNIQMTKPSEVG